ncbi:hypothetical protein ES707_06533 [subsurface metagenome]
MRHEQVVGGDVERAQPEARQRVGRQYRLILAVRDKILAPDERARRDKARRGQIAALADHDAIRQGQRQRSLEWELLVRHLPFAGDRSKVHRATELRHHGGHGHASCIVAFGISRLVGLVERVEGFRQVPTLMDEARSAGDSGVLQHGIGSFHAVDSAIDPEQIGGRHGARQERDLAASDVDHGARLLDDLRHRSRGEFGLQTD